MKCQKKREFVQSEEIVKGARRSCFSPRQNLPTLLKTGLITCTIEVRMEVYYVTKLSLSYLLLKYYIDYSSFRIILFLSW